MSPCKAASLVDVAFFFLSLRARLAAPRWSCGSAVQPPQHRRLQAIPQRIRVDSRSLKGFFALIPLLVLRLPSGPVPKKKKMPFSPERLRCKTVMIRLRRSSKGCPYEPSTQESCSHSRNGLRAHVPQLKARIRLVPRTRERRAILEATARDTEIAMGKVLLWRR